MSEQNEKFTLEKLDHLIEEFAQDDPSLPEVRLLQDLQRAQKARDRIVTRATERVWQRLQAGERSNRIVEEDAHIISSILSQPLANNTRRGLLKMKNFDKSGELPKRQSRRLFVALAAVLIVGLFVGTFALFTQLYHAQSTNSGAKPHTSIKTASLPDSLYYTWGGGVVKLDKQTGKVLWTFHAPGWQPSQSQSLFPLWKGNAETITASTDSTVYFTYSALNASSKNTSTFTLHEHAINAQDGSLRWSYTSQGDMAPNSAVLSGNILYIGVNTGMSIQTSGNQQMENGPTGSYMLALNAQNGKQLWHTPLKGAIGGGLAGGGSLVVSNGLVYVSIKGGFTGESDSAKLNGIEALHAQDGAQGWWASTGTIQWQSPLLVTRTLVYTITMGWNSQNGNSTIVHAFDAQSGTPRWSTAPIMGVTITGVTPILDDGKIYFCATFGAEANNTGKIFVLDPTSGKQLQVYSLPLELYKLIPVNGHVVIGYATHNPVSIKKYGNAGLLELDITFHNQLWMDNNLNGDNAFPISPLLDNGVLYFIAETQVEAANLATGKIIWQQDMSKQVNP